MSGKYGRVKVSLAMGSGRKRLEHLRIINRCNSIGELNEKTALLRIWRVEIMQQENEDKVDGDGFCGYAAMTNIINGIDRRLSMKRRQDRLEVGMAIRNMIAKGKGSMRKEWKKIRSTDLNHKERAEGAYEELMKEQSHFLSHKGLGAEYWLEGSLIEDRCEELRFSRWDKSSRQKGAYELVESKFEKRGRILAYGEWKELIKEKMLMFGDRHFYVRDQDLNEDMEKAMDELGRKWHMKLGLECGVSTRIVEDIQLIDLTPMGPCDTLLVAEAVISKDERPRLLDLNEPDTRGKLRNVEYGLELFEAESLGLSINLGKGSVIGSSIGATRMQEICKENMTGFVRIRDGVMERLLPKSSRPDVIHDEDIDHFYLNGVGKKRIDEVVIKNSVIFWNCNGWRGDGTIDKADLLGAIAKDEGAEMMCITDVRLDNLDGMRGIKGICRRIGTSTGKTWAGVYISRREDKKSGGTYIFHTIDWTKIKIIEKMKYGVVTEITGNWNGKKHKIVSVYRPCYSSAEGSLRLAMDLDWKGRFEEKFWDSINETCEAQCIVGGDFNMEKDQLNKKIKDRNMNMRRVEMEGNPFTFHRWDNVNRNMQKTTIDHVMISDGEIGGAKVSDTGLDLNDHSIVIGWVKAPPGIMIKKEMKGVRKPSLRPSDKGATKRFEKAWSRIHDNKIKDMSMEDIVKENMGSGKRIINNRNTKLNPNGWSPISRLISLRISVHGTARRMKDRIDYVRIMSQRVEELKRSEESLVLSDTEIGWLRDNGLSENRLTGKNGKYSLEGRITMTIR